MSGKNLTNAPAGSVCCPRCGGSGYVEQGAITIGDRVRSFREQRRMTQADLAKAVGLSRAQIANIEGDRSSITLDKLRAFSGTLQCPVEMLVP